jgi:hypothetical protein
MALPGHDDAARGGTTQASAYAAAFTSECNDSGIPPEPPQVPAEFLILSPYRVDDVWLFWRHGGSGYTADLNEAGRFSEAKAHNHTRSTHGEHIAVPAAEVLAVSVPVVMYSAGRALRDKFGKAALAAPAAGGNQGGAS